MTYKETSDTGQGAILNNQDIFGCLFLCLKKPAIKGFYKILFFWRIKKYHTIFTNCEYKCEYKTPSLTYQTNFGII